MYFKTAIRNLSRHRKHALINILGLAVALAACIVIFLVLQFEFSFDKHLTGYNNIYQVITKEVDGDGDSWTAGIPFPAVKFLRNDFPQYTFGQLMQNFGAQVTAKNTAGIITGKKFIEDDGVFYADPETVKLFEVKFIAGNADVLKDVSSVALNKTMAEKYFGSVNAAMGERINFDNEKADYQVAAIFEDVPANSDFPFKIVAAYEGFVANNSKDGWPLEDWGSNSSNHQVYVKLPDHTDIAGINKQLALFEKKYNNANKDTKRLHELNPLASLHFERRYSDTGNESVNKTSLYALAFIGMLIILMACINFINLSTALAVTRSKETGIRKVLGSTKNQMRLQVFAETILVVMLAVSIAIVLAWTALPYVKNIVMVQSRLYIFNTGSILFIVGISVITIVLSALYPALIMSRFNPVEAIKSKISNNKAGSISLRRALVVLQFTFSQILIIATIIAIAQMNFISNTDLGFNKEAVLILHGNSDSSSIARHQAFKDALLALHDVKDVTFSFDAPSSDNSWQSNFAFDIMQDRDFNVNLKFGDENYLKTYGMQLAAGRFYDASDTARTYVVNETLLKKVGIKNPGDALGKMFRLGGGEPRPVIGVVKDFKMQSLREEVPPLVLLQRQKYYSTTGIKLSSINLFRSKDEIQKVWDKYFPEYVFNSIFFDESINNFYLQDQRLTLLYKVYAALAIVISCLGLYGLVSFMVVQKTKEVGIRKVLGASVKNIIYLFSKEFTVLIALAFLIAAPAAWYLMNAWLQDFHFRIKTGPGVFLLAIFISMIIAWITVGYKALSAAVANPVKSLRTE